MILKAKYVYPVSRPDIAGPGLVIENGLVEMVESRIVDVRRAAKHESGASLVDCGDAVLLPGFVNAHTHLELTHLAGKVPPRGASGPRGPSPAAHAGPADFADWLRRLVGKLRETQDDPEVVTASVNAGATACLRAGVTTVGDITRLPRIARPALQYGWLRVVSFGEVIAVGGRRARLRARVKAAADNAYDSDRLSAAVSPHATYTCDRRALRACKGAAEAANLRMCMHLAESQEEEACTLTGTGPLADFLRSVGLWDDSVRHPGLRPVECAEELGLPSPRMLFAHVNYISDAEMARLARAGAHVAYCPRTHAAFNHAPHRFREMRTAGINVCVATDSLASNPSLSVLDELRYLRSAFADVDNGALIAMGTLGAAEALGLGDLVGSLVPGKQADVVAVPLQPAGARDPLENLLRSDLPATQVYVAGRLAQGAGAG